MSTIAKLLGLQPEQSVTATAVQGYNGTTIFGGALGGYQQQPPMPTFQGWQQQAIPEEEARLRQREAEDLHNKMMQSIHNKMMQSIKIQQAQQVRTSPPRPKMTFVWGDFSD